MNKALSYINEFLRMTFGILLTAIALYYFAVPYNLITGTVSGLCMVINHFVGGSTATLSYWIMGVNALLLCLAFVTIGKGFGAKTVYTSMAIGPMMRLLDYVYPYTHFTHELIDGELVQVRYSVLSSGMGTGEIWFDIVCFCLILGASQAFLFRMDASTGGLDIVAKIMSKYLHIDIGDGITISGCVACATGFFVNDFRMVVIGLVTTWINGIAVSYFTASFNRRKRVCIISEQYEQIREYIIKELVRGCSLYRVTGGYSNQEQIEIQALLTQEEFGKLMNYMDKNKIKAFTTAGNCSEVYGLWLKHRKHNGHVEIA